MWTYVGIGNLFILPAFVSHELSLESILRYIECYFFCLDLYWNGRIADKKILIVQILVVIFYV